MHTRPHAEAGAAAGIPVNAASPVVSYSPVVIAAPKRHGGVDIEVRATFPARSSSTEEGSAGRPLPVIVFSHGQGKSYWLSSLEGYAPLSEFWAAHGFCVLQPTHLSSRFLGLGEQAKEGDEMFWQERTTDISAVIDSLDVIERSVPGLADRGLDKTRIGVAGHSAGCIGASLVLGARNTDPRTGQTWDLSDKRIKAGVILGGLGSGVSSGSLSDWAKSMIPFWDVDFGTLTTPTMTVYGDADQSAHLTVRGAEWHADPYKLSPGPDKVLLKVHGGKHSLGGVSGWDAAETEKDDETPAALAVVQRMTWAYLWSRLFEEKEGGESVWTEACSSLERQEMKDMATVESK